MAKKNVSEIERGAGFFQALITSIMDVARENGVPFEAIHWLTTPKGRETLGDMVQMADTNHRQERGEKRRLAENEYLVHVGYDMPCDKSVLDGEFSEHGVSPLFTYGHEWVPHSSCTEIDQTPGKRVMLLKHFNRSTTSEWIIVVMDKLGYRPATHLEAYAFAKANPELQRQFPIVALGSSVVDARELSVALLGSNSGGRTLCHDWCGSGWRSEIRFLFVLKDS